MQHPQNDTMPHCLWNKNTVEVSIYKTRASFRACFCYHSYFFYITVCHLGQLTWLSPKMPPWRKADSKSSKPEWTEPPLLPCMQLGVLVWKKDPVPGLHYVNVRAMLGIICISSYRRKRASRCYWNTELHPLAFAAQILHQNRAPMAWSHP